MSDEKYTLELELIPRDGDLGKIQQTAQNLQATASILVQPQRSASSWVSIATAAVLGGVNRHFSNRRISVPPPRRPDETIKYTPRVNRNVLAHRVSTPGRATIRVNPAAQSRSRALLQQRMEATQTSGFVPPRGHTGRTSRIQVIRAASEQRKFDDMQAEVFGRTGGKIARLDPGLAPAFKYATPPGEVLPTFGGQTWEDFENAVYFQSQTLKVDTSMTKPSYYAIQE